MSPKTAVGYVRVSTAGQVDGQSLKTQQEAIEQYCKKENIELIQIYRDEGISGGSVEKRPALVRLLENVNGVNYVIVHRLSRLGRNVRELLNNIDFLTNANVEVVFQKDQIDLSTPHGRLMLQLLGAIAEFEKEITRESSLENKYSLCRQGIPATGKTPFGRKYDRKTNEWYFDPPDIKEVFQDITDRFLNGETLKDIADTIPKKYKLSYSNILKVYKNAAGDTWEVKFKDMETPITYQIPPLIDQETLAKVWERLEFNRFCNRTDATHKYLLSGFIKCAGCGRALVGQVQKYKDKDYYYYHHPHGKREKCRIMGSITCAKIENAVFQTIFENVVDEDSFNDAIQQNMPDPTARQDLEKEAQNIRKELDKTSKEQQKLVDALLNETLSESVIKETSDKLEKRQKQLEKELRKKEVKLSNMPTIESYQEDSKELRAIFVDYFGSQEHYNKMTFDQKRRLLHTIFDGKDEDGQPHAVYIKKISKGVYDYFINAKLFAGARYLKGDDFDFDPEDGPGDGPGGTNQTPSKTSKNHGTKASNDYNTKISGINNIERSYKRFSFQIADILVTN